MNLQIIFEQQNYILLTVFIILVLMSIVTWVIILVRTIKLWLAKFRNKRFTIIFWQAENLQTAIDSIRNIYAPMSFVAIKSYQAQQNYVTQPHGRLHNTVPQGEYIVRHIRHNLNKALLPFDSGLTVLASIGATAPFIGLFGTVLGIYHALINIGIAGQVTIAAVAGPIGEALIATAVGLFAAIPAVLGYNALVRANKNLAHDMDSFAHDLHVQFLNSEDK
ncbi:MotA/TolQ/ExbB proton channel family protein [Testudinibacter sp. P27/CKL/0425]